MAQPAEAPATTAPQQDDSDLLAGIPPQQDDSDLLAGIPSWQQPSGSSPLPPADDPMFLHRDWERVKGFAKGIARTGAGALDLANTDANAADPSRRTYLSSTLHDFANTVRARTQTTNPQQDIGDFVESALELTAVPEVGEEGIAKTLADKFNVGQDLAKFAQKYPKLAAAWNVMRAGATTAGRAGAEQGAQTYLKTGGDMPATAQATGTGAAWGGALGTIARAVGETRNLIEGARPGSRTVAGADFETQPRTNDLLLRNTKDVEQDPATQAVDEAMGNMGKTAVANSVNRSNAARAPEGEIIPPSRRLPGRAGFEVGPAGETTPVEGQTVFEARKKQIGTRTIEGKGPGQFNLEQYETGQETPPTGEGELTQQGSHREPVWQYQTDVRPGQPEPITSGETGPGTMILTDDGQAMSPERARQQVAQYERILNDPDEVDQMGVRQHQDIVNAHADLSDQLSRFDNYAASQPHFPPLDPVAMVRNTDSLGDAATQLKAGHAPFWQAADEASGGQFSALRDEEKRLEKQIYGANPTGRLDDLRQQLAENQQKQMDFFDKYKTTVSPQEWDTARSGYQDGIVLGNLDSMLQKKFGGISRELEQRGIASGNQRQRVFQPGKDFNQQLEDFYNGGFRNAPTNREVLMRTIGQQHMDSLHDLGIMFNSTERMEQTKGLAGNILTSIRHHYHGVRGILAGGGGVGMLAAGQAAHAAGIGFAPMLTGTGAGINRYIGEKLITDPDFLKIFSYALKNGIPARTAGPLLAARIISTWQNQPLKQKTQQPPQPAQKEP